MRVENYYRPATLDEAVSLMSKEASPKALAGGTDLIIAIEDGSAKPSAIIDLSDIKEMKGIRIDGDKMHIGAMTTFTEVSTNDLVKKHFPLLARAASLVGSPQVRNSGTVGGNLANAATAADTVPCFMALDAVAVVASKDGSKEIAVTEIPTGLNSTCLKDNELIVEFIVPLCDDAFTDFEKIGRRKALAISRINMAMVLTMDGSTIKTANIAFGAVGKKAYRAKKVEDALIGKSLDDSLIDAACDCADALIVEELAGRSTTPYKRKIGSAVIREALKKAKGGI